MGREYHFYALPVLHLGITRASLQYQGKKISHPEGWEISVLQAFRRDLDFLQDARQAPLDGSPSEVKLCGNVHLRKPINKIQTSNFFVFRAYVGLVNRSRHLAFCQTIQLRRETKPRLRCHYFRRYVQLLRPMMPSTPRLCSACILRTPASIFGPNSLSVAGMAWG